MKRVIIVYNPRSSQYARVREEVLKPARGLTGCMVGKYEVRQIGLEENIKALAKIVEEGDLVVSAGGDATGIIAVNAVMKSGVKAMVSVLPYGNFNDLARTLGVGKIEEIFEKKVRRVKFYPLEVWVDGKFWRYATCYVTMGMTAEAVKLYDKPQMRRKLKKEFGRQVTSYTELIRWYLKHRRGKLFIPEFKLNGKLQARDTSDYAAVNGRYMARVMQGREDYLRPRRFRSMADRLAVVWRMCWLMMRSIVDRVPGRDTYGDKLEFLAPSRVELQAEGESEVFRDVREIEVRKGGRYFWALIKEES